MPVRSIITNPTNGAKLAAGTTRGQAARRLLGRRRHGAARSTSRSISAPPGRRPASEKPKNKYDWQRWTATVKLPSDGYFEIWSRATDSQRRDAAAHGRLLESAGLWRQRHAPHRRAGGMSHAFRPPPRRIAARVRGDRPSTNGSHDRHPQIPAHCRTVGHAGVGWRSIAGSGLFAARRRSRISSPPAPAATRPSTPARPATISSWWRRRA